jgi:hypothetical protein
MNTVIRYEQIAATTSAVAIDHLVASLSVLGGMTRRLDQFVCGLAGHDELMRFEPKRLSLRCTRCAHQTAGWDMTSPRPRRLLPA